jgi:lactam utilization protein B
MHGDTAEAVEMAAEVRRALEGAGVGIKSLREVLR